MVSCRRSHYNEVTQDDRTDTDARGGSKVGKRKTPEESKEEERTRRQELEPNKKCGKTYEHHSEANESGNKRGDQRRETRARGDDVLDMENVTDDGRKGNDKAGEARRGLTQLRKTLGAFYARGYSCKRFRQHGETQGTDVYHDDNPLLPGVACEGVPVNKERDTRREEQASSEGEAYVDFQEDLRCTSSLQTTNDMMVATTNVAFSPEGFGHSDGAENHTPLGRYLQQLQERPVYVDAIQEHRLGPYDYQRIPGLEEVAPEFRWIGWPGQQEEDTGARTKGLGFILHNTLSVIDSEYSSSDLCEMASITVRRSRSETRETFINVYLTSGGGVEAVCELEAMGNTHMQKARRLGPVAFWVLGDLNVNAWSNGPAARAVREVCGRWQATRYDMQSPFEMMSTWARIAVRNGNKTVMNSHIDAIIHMPQCMCTLEGVHIDDWDTNDHLRLSAQVSYTGVPKEQQSKQDEAKKAAPAIRRYNYERATDGQREMYARNTNMYANNGVKQALDQHLECAQSDEMEGGVKAQMAGVATCMITASLHSSAYRSMENLLRRKRKPVSNKSAEFILNKCKRKKITTDWERINSLRTDKLKAGESGNRRDDPAILVDGTNGKTLIRGAAQVQEELENHAKKVSIHDASDEDFEASFEGEVRTAVEKIRGAQGGSFGIEGSEDIERLCEGTPTEGEFQYAVEKLKGKMGGAPARDGVVPWMIVWAGRDMRKCIFKLMLLLWRLKELPPPWTLALDRYIPKPGCRGGADISMHRPVRLRSVMGKMFTIIWLLRLKGVMAGKMPDMQFGFQAHMDSYTAVWALQQAMMQQASNDKEVGREVWLLLCDWAKAYDKVWRDMSMLLLHAHGVRGTLWQLIDMWINKTVIEATFNGTCTERFQVSAGLGQGCVLSALVFVVFMATLTEQPPAAATGNSYHFADIIRQAYEHRLKDGDGMAVAGHATRVAMPALICADDTNMLSNTREGMTRMLGSFNKWKYRMRFVANHKKWHLFTAEAATSRKANMHLRLRRMEHTHLVISSENGGQARTLQAERNVTLLGCTIQHTPAGSDLFKKYASKVMAHQLTLSRIRHSLGHDLAVEYVRACPKTRVMAEAALDYAVAGEIGDHTMDRLQRTLWAGGVTSAIGISHKGGGRTNGNLLLMLIGGLNWSREVRLGRILVWRRLLRTVKQDSWQAGIARLMQEQAVADINESGTPKHEYLRAVHKDLIAFGYEGGLTATMPAGCADANAGDLMAMEQRARERLLNGADKQETRSSISQLWEKERWVRVERSWEQRNFDPDVIGPDVMEWVGCYVRETGERAVGGCESNEDGMYGDWGEDKEHLALMRDERREEACMLREWIRDLRAGAVKEQREEVRKWATTYVPSDDRLGRGEAALWLKVNKCGDCEEGQEAHMSVMELVGPPNSSRTQDRFARLLAGSTLTMRAHMCKTAKEFKHESTATDVRRKDMMRCPCGARCQDSVHTLECQMREMVDLRQTVCDQVREVMERHAKEVVVETRRREHAVDRARRRKGGDRAHPLREVPTARLLMMRDEINEAMQGEPETMLLYSLGKSPTALTKHIRRDLCSAAARTWSKVEEIWSTE